MACDLSAFSVDTLLQDIPGSSWIEWRMASGDFSFSLWCFVIHDLASGLKKTF